MARQARGMARFAAFLRAVESEKDRTRQRGGNIVFGIVAILCALLLIASWQQSSGIWCFAWIGPFVAGGYARDAFNKWRDRREARASALDAHYQEMLTEYRRMDQNAILSDRFHPALVEPVDRAAAAYLQTLTWLQQSASKNVLGNDLHSDVQKSIHQAMREVVLATHGYFRPKGMQRKKWNQIVDLDPHADSAIETVVAASDLMLQLVEIAKRTEEMGRTITLMDQLKAIQRAISEMEETSLLNLKALPAPKSTGSTHVQ